MRRVTAGHAWWVGGSDRGGSEQGDEMRTSGICSRRWRHRASNRATNSGSVRCRIASETATILNEAALRGASTGPRASKRRPHRPDAQGKHWAAWAADGSRWSKRRTRHDQRALLPSETQSRGKRPLKIKLVRAWHCYRIPGSCPPIGCKPYK